MLSLLWMNRQNHYQKRLWRTLLWFNTKWCQSASVRCCPRHGSQFVVLSCLLFLSHAPAFLTEKPVIEAANKFILINQARSNFNLCTKGSHLIKSKLNVCQKQIQPSLCPLSLVQKCSWWWSTTKQSGAIEDRTTTLWLYCSLHIHA